MKVIEICHKCGDLCIKIETCYSCWALDVYAKTTPERREGFLNQNRVRIRQRLLRMLPFDVATQADTMGMTSRELYDLAVTCETLKQASA